MGDTPVTAERPASPLSTAPTASRPDTIQSPGDRTSPADRSWETDVSQPWEKDNQAWWDWYVSLADNSLDRTDGAEALADGDPGAPGFAQIAALADPAIKAELNAPYPVTDDQVRFFQANGFIKLKDVLSPGAVKRLRQELVALLEGDFKVTLDGGAKDRFLSLEMVWLSHALVRAFVLSPRIAKICADLLGVDRVRLYHDNVLSKEPGCGRTPWHFDDHHFPLATHDVVTAWIPAQPIPRAMGPLAFARPIDVHRLVADVPFNKVDTSYDRHVAQVFEDRGVEIEDGPFALGEVSFHHNLSFHAAAGNRTDRSRIVLANTYFVDGARVVDHPTMVSGDWQKFIPGAGPGDVAASPLNPVCWPPEAGGAEAKTHV